MHTTVSFGLLLLAPMVIVGLLLIWRRRRVSSTRKSPLTSDLLRPPGQRLREQLDKLRDDADTMLMMVVLVPVLAFAVFMAKPGQESSQGLPDLPPVSVPR